MEVLTQYHDIAAAFIARIFLGLLFFFQGYDAVVRVKLKNVLTTYESPFESIGVPKFLTVLGVWYTSYSELIGGILLTFGLFEQCALYLLGINLIIASIAFSINAPMWDMRHVFPRLALLLFLLVIPPTWSVWTLDHLIF
jgi:uncharacterized membrane protein YphA (DoxX/SURF4 family)